MKGAPLSPQKLDPASRFEGSARRCGTLAYLRQTLQDFYMQIALVRDIACNVTFFRSGNGFLQHTASDQNIT
ncbi:hypothetical protein F2P81_017555 [Scophthalmus maximus]|uniref:Uncharacterized protein n=1 Tax=Scophthalmus maximus TaxID=52904 RepID=A0A6A4SIN4_SCOMX|nr:hypothetical protein F2P81_017555 [Scophthalmus maximus]